MKSHSHPPIYVQMIGLLKNALELLDEQGREEVMQFILASQHENGGFRDRGGSPDLYYSLFGMLILKAMAAKPTGSPENKPKENPSALDAIQASVANSLLKLKQFTQRPSSLKVPGFIERCSLLLLQTELKSNRYSRFLSLVSLGKSFWKERSSINLSYRSFVLFLTLEAILPLSSLIKRPAKRMMAQTEVNEHSPCSEVAAKVFLLKMMNQQNTRETALLSSFAARSGGFKAFLHLEHADMLSTAVALFALNNAGADLRLLKPSMLEFIQSNYRDGAFLSGDGDSTADVEYTFYGLLALGVLVS